MESFWEQTVKMPEFESLNGDTQTDVLIIGGGIAGILCAYMLNQAGIDYILVEAETLCSGVTKYTTAKITSQHGLIYAKLINEFGLEKAKQYLTANELALQKYRELCSKIDCDFESTDAYAYSLDNPKKISDEISALRKLHFSAEHVTSLPLPFSIAGAVKFKNQAQFNPLKFLSAISRGLRIHEHTRVLELVGKTAITNCGRIAAKRIIVATHFPFINKHGSYFLKMYQHRSYVLMLENAENVNGMYIDEDEKGLSFRNYKDLLFVGGGSHRTGKTGGNWQELRIFVNKYYSDSNILCRTATQDCMTLDGVPYIGRYSANTDGLYVATGFNKWGMTSAMVSAMLLSDMLQGKVNPNAPVFSPSRTILRPQLALNALEAFADVLTPSLKRCPHLGCALKWNPAEHTWDCPCHGSRFTSDGKLIDNPATGDLPESNI